MIKFMVVLYKRPDLSVEDFQRYLRQVHGPLAGRLKGLVRYLQNHVAPDPKRAPPGWHAIVELYFEGREVMEAAWASEAGGAAGADLEHFADLERSRWSVVEELNIL